MAKLGLLQAAESMLSDRVYTHNERYIERFHYDGFYYYGVSGLKKLVPKSIV